MFRPCLAIFRSQVDVIHKWGENAPALSSTISATHEPNHARLTKILQQPQQTIVSTNLPRKKQDFSETRLSCNTARTEDHTASLPRTSKPKFRITFQIITCLSQINCNNEISLNIIYLLHLGNSYVYTIVFFSSFVYNVNLWPEDGQARPKHVVTIAAINTKPRQLCFWRSLLPAFDI
jgi:hypothetical protein